jgi:two-component system NtrC family sensor kinase
MSQASPSKFRSDWSDDLLWALAVFDSAVLLLDREQRITHANAAAHALAARIDPARPEPGRLLELLPAGALDAANAEGRWHGDVVAGDGDGITLQITAYCGEHGGVRRRFVVLDDVSARVAREQELTHRHDELERTYKRLASTQEQLLQTEKMASIGQLAAGVAHEINNPIGYVHSNLGTLRDYAGALIALVEAYGREFPTDHPGAAGLQQLRERLDIDFIVGDLPQLLDESREGIERVTKIVQDLKEFSHVGRDEPVRAVDLHKGLDSTLNIVWNDLKYKVRLEKHYGELPPVECHPSEINQVFMNLLINAGQAIAERGTITITTGVDGDEVWTSIVDSGCGIPEETLARIFDPFYTTKPIGRGTGLGLAICYGIVAKHHGRIEVSSRLGFGSTFKVVLPVKQPTGEAVVA